MLSNCARLILFRTDLGGCAVCPMQEAALIFNAHHNVQRIVNTAWSFYLLKYAMKVRCPSTLPVDSISLASTRHAFAARLVRPSPHMQDHPPIHLRAALGAFVYVCLPYPMRIVPHPPSPLLYQPFRPHVSGCRNGHTIISHMRLNRVMHTDP